MNFTASLVTALVATGMGLSFVRTDPRSSTSRALSLCLIAVGASIMANYPVLHVAVDEQLPIWLYLGPLTDTIAFVAGYQWIWYVRRTIPAGRLKTRFGDNALRVAQLLALVYLGLSMALPQMRAQFFMHGFFNREAMTGFEFYLFAAPLEIGMLLAMTSIVLCLNRKPDSAEQVRLIAFLIATPFIASGLVLPEVIAPVGTVTGLMIMLVGAMRYHVLQGQRGIFLSRFLSPNVATLVNRQGLETAITDDNHEISIVCCDLRSFTAYAAASESSQVMELLREYYDSVGEVVTRYEGTIKDYAGDGILVLFGAPVPMPDHAERAVRAALAIRAAAEVVTRRWSRPGLPLGIGIGVASGPVTVGLVGGRERLEYAAVGPAVNLASRLCEMAGFGEILADRHTIELAAELDAVAEFRPREPVSLKGFDLPVANFAN